jgi:hypothetical protein
MVRRLIAACPLGAALLPAAVLGIVTAVMMIEAAAGAHPLWRVEPVNLSEAAALREQATVVQLIRRGEDPYARREVRADLLFNDRAELTPIEAAIAAGRTEIVEIILWAAPRPEPAVWVRARCISQLEGAENINAILDKYRPESAIVNCDGVTRPWK